MEPRTTKHRPSVLEQDAGFEEGPTNTISKTALISTIVGTDFYNRWSKRFSGRDFEIP